jgi:hypothetical protein
LLKSRFIAQPAPNALGSAAESNTLSCASLAASAPFATSS